MNIQLLIKYYQQYRIKIADTLKMRQINQDTNKIDVAIEELKDLSNKFNNICREKNSTDDKEKNIELKEEKRRVALLISKKEEELKYELLCLPCITDTDTQEDVVVKTCDKFQYNANYSFEEYINKHLIKVAERALIFNEELSKLKEELYQLYTETNKKSGFKYIGVPVLVNEEMLIQSGHLPKFKENLFMVRKNLFLVPTSETLLLQAAVHMYDRENTFRMFTTTSCFRNEDAAPGKVNKPLIRQGCFEKTETFIIGKKSDRKELIGELLSNVEKMLIELKLNYRILKVGTKEMGGAAYLQYDFEVYMPSLKQYIEVGSCSDCDSYQLIRCDYPDYEKYCTFNCTALSFERILAALIEYRL